MATQVVSVGYGKANFSARSVSMASFVVSDGFVRELPSKTFTKNGSTQRFPASNYPEVNGSMFLDSIRVPDGTVIMVQAQHKRSGLPVSDGAMFVCTRSTGPMIAVQAAIPASPESMLAETFLVFQGRGDVLNIKELASYNILPPKSWAKGFLNKEEVDECYSVDVLMQETSRKPELELIEDREGTLVMVAKKPARRLTMRRA